MHDQRRTRLTAARIWSRQNVITTVLALFIALSLIIHGITLWNLLRIRAIVSTQLDVSAAQVAQLRQQQIRTAFPVQQTFPISTTVPISETIEVPVRFDVPINQTVRIPINTPLGTVPIEVPLDLTVPVSNTITVPINRQIPFRTEVSIDTSVPVEVSLSTPPVGDVLQQLENGLRDLRRQLSPEE